MFLLQTPQLRLREILLSDADFAYNLNLDPEVIKYTGDEPFASVAEAQEFLIGYDHYQKFGYGRWLVELREDGRPLGWCGLKNQMDELGIIDLGYRFFKNEWGKGYALEAAEACLKWGFEEKGMDTITARIAIGNERSVRLAVRLGMRFHKEEECHTLPARWYSLTANEWFVHQGKDVSSRHQK
jgi:[ribosomal protein S5]-alanine N-acetyltransferase